MIERTNGRSEYTPLDRRVDNLVEEAQRFRLRIIIWACLIGGGIVGYILGCLMLN